MSTSKPYVEIEEVDLRPLRGEPPRTTGPLRHVLVWDPNEEMSPKTPSWKEIGVRCFRLLKESLRQPRRHVMFVDPPRIEAAKLLAERLGISVSVVSKQRLRLHILGWKNYLRYMGFKDP